MTFMAISSGRGHGVRQQGDLPRALDGLGHVALVSGAVTADAPGNDLAPLGHEQLEQVGILVVDDGAAIGAEPAHLLAAEAATAGATGAAALAAVAAISAVAVPAAIEITRCHVVSPGPWPGSILVVVAAAVVIARLHG